MVLWCTAYGEEQQEYQQSFDFHKGGEWQGLNTATTNRVTTGILNNNTMDVL